MATCFKCKNPRLSWVNEKGKWRLYDSTTGEFHDCKLTTTEYADKAVKSGMATYRRSGYACKHGILRDRWCDECGEEDATRN